MNGPAVPFEWNEVTIIPLPKKGSRNKSDNYRPVSLTSVICKSLDRLIREFVEQKLINQYQHGFLKARSYLIYILYFSKKKSLSRSCLLKF